jgi:hypothetical protein
MNNQKKNYKISDHFSSKDFVCNCGNCDKAFKTSLGLIGGLELLRTKAKARIEIVKGYVCPECAESQTFFKKNYHVLGIAADITCKNLSLKDFFLLIEEIQEFKGIGIDVSKKHIHVDTRKSGERHIWIIDDEKQVDIDESNRKFYIENLQ